ncbi:MAG: class I SAM-dependent methyltransferase [Pseudomonadota bacterium]|nr:class I SAM-dependent methyltransferase [Pseudomonadota bacterium]
MDGTPFDSTRRFWNHNPCNLQDNYESRRIYRYRMEPWLPSFIEKIARRHSDVVEIGCGQGTDGLEFCRHLDPKGSYTGIDLSDESVARAFQAYEEISGRGALKVVPRFRQGNAEALELGSGSVSCIYSMGVLHHSPNPPQTVQEIYRVLSPGGKAYICLYKNMSLKVGAAKFLRGMQHVIDFIFGTRRGIYEFLKRRPRKFWGTMLHECFGVPYMFWYTRSQMRHLFRDFNILSLKSYGANLPFAKYDGRETLFGYFWVIEVQKPAT